MSRMLASPRSHRGKSLAMCCLGPTPPPTQLSSTQQMSPGAQTQSMSALPALLDIPSNSTIGSVSDLTSPREMEVVWDEQQVEEAVHLFLRQTEVTTLSGEILSIHKRGITVASWNSILGKRCIIRVSPWFGLKQKTSITARDLSLGHQTANRILFFGEGMAHSQKIQETPGIVPFLASPMIFRDQFLIEQYEEVVFGEENKRVDLHTFISSGMDNGNARKSLEYLYDVLCGLLEMHGRGWAHLDLSLENVVLSNHGAVIVDFESALPFSTLENGCIQRKDLRVPVKMPFVPIEHLVARLQDWFSLPAYDVWAFGVMFFTVLFREYLFGSHRVKNTDGNSIHTLIPDPAQVQYFMDHGFRTFIKKYHREKYKLLFFPEAQNLDRRTVKYLKMAGDLMAKIFRRPCVIQLDDPDHIDGSTMWPCEHEDGSIYFCDCKRLTAQGVYEHPFWAEHGIGGKKK